MRHRTFAIIAVALTALLLAVGGGAYAYDASRSDVIADGVTVAGVDVGGLHADVARKRVRRALVRRLHRPIVAMQGDQRFRLTARQLHIRIDAAGMVDRALAESRDGSFVTRTLRRLGIGGTQATIPAQVAYSRAAVKRFVAHVDGELARDPQDATLEFSATEPQPVAGHEGVAVATARLRRAILRRLDAHDTRGGPIAVRTHAVEPEVTTEELAEQYPTVLIVDRGAYKLRLFKDLELVKTYDIAVGQVGRETPAGLYHIQNKAVDPAWNVPNSDWAGDLAGTVVPGGTPENPLKARWLGIYDGAGIHGTDADASIGSAASHGCVRMHIPDVIDLYDRVPVGAPIYIA